jgi:hypothetical protein
MKHLKSRIDFLNESDYSDFGLVKKLAEKVKSDIQLDRGNEDFMGFLNLDPRDPWDQGWKDGMEALYRMLKDDNSTAKSILADYGLEIESAFDSELIIREIKNYYKNWDKEEFLKHIGCELTDKGWSCRSVIASYDSTPLTKDGKLTVQFNELSGVFDVNNCNLTSLEGSPRKAKAGFVSQGNRLPDGVLNWYIYIIMQKKDGYDDYWASLLMYLLNRHPEEVDKVNWPEGYLDENLKKSAKALGKYNI